jgi:hypothetical protein
MAVLNMSKLRIFAASAATVLVACAPAWAQSRLTPTFPRAAGHFGASVAGVPDINGNGRGDVVVGAPYEDASGVPGAGRVYVYNGATGMLMRVLTSPTPRVNGAFGYAVAGVPDMDGDGRGDILVGAPQEGINPIATGKAYIFSGRTGVLRRQLNSPARQTGGNFGHAIAGLDDVDGDGFGDVVVGAPGEAPGLSLPGEGRAYVYSGRTGRLLHKVLAPHSVQNGGFGFSVAAVPDVNADGRGDFVVGAPRVNAPGAPINSGRAYIFNGRTGQRIRQLQSAGQQENGFFGYSVGGLQDVDGDGGGDVVIGAPFDSPGTDPEGAGRAYIYNGRTGSFRRTLRSPFPQENGQFGISVAGVPDTLLDGWGDVIVGAWNEAPNAQAAPANAGRAYLYSGRLGQHFLTLRSPGEMVDGHFGVAVAGIPSTTASPRGDFVVGAAAENQGGHADLAGRAYIFRR